VRQSARQMGESHCHEQSGWHWAATSESAAAKRRKKTKEGTANVVWQAGADCRCAAARWDRFYNRAKWGNLLKITRAIEGARSARGA